MAGVGEDVRGQTKYLSSHVHENYTKHKAYIQINLILVIDVQVVSIGIQFYVYC